MSTRADVRIYFAALLRNALVGDGKPAQAVYDHLVGDFEGKSPVLVVASGGSARKQFGRRTWAPASYAIELYYFVLYALADGTWAEGDADALLDTLDDAVAEVVINHQTSAHWSAIAYEGRSAIANVTIGGLTYRGETALLVFGPESQ